MIFDSLLKWMDGNIRVTVALDETLKELAEAYGIPPQEIGAVPGEYHPSGVVVEGSAIYPIEDETRLIAGTRVSEKE